MMLTKLVASWLFAVSPTTSLVQKAQIGALGAMGGSPSGGGGGGGGGSLIDQSGINLVDQSGNALTAN